MKNLKKLIFITSFIFCLLLTSSCEEEEKLIGNRIAQVSTSKGDFTFVLYEKRAPITTKNFIDLAESKFYDGLTYHRYVKDFVIQGGDPLGTGMGGSDDKIKLETHPELKHSSAGIVAMARSSDPDSASSQYYVTLGPTPNLDNSYAVFGKVIKGLNVVMQLREGDVMKQVTIITPESKK